MSQKTVYLAGPITGHSFLSTNNWRKEAIEFLRKNGIVGLSPLREKNYLQFEDQIADAYDGEAVRSVLSTSRGIYTRDRFDCFNCDCLLVNFLGVDKVSIGTVMEIAWADSRQIPIIAAMDPLLKTHDHSMIREAIGFRVESLKDALQTAVHILGAYSPVQHIE